MFTLAPGSSLLRSAIGEPSTNDLRLVVLEARPQADPVETSIGPARPIVPDASSRGFELIWWRYVAYAVRNESYARREEGQPVGTGPVGMREASAFLRYVQAATIATDGYPGSLMHWFVDTEWQCIDVVSDSPPDIRELTASEVEAARHTSLLQNAPLVARAS